ITEAQCIYCGRVCRFDGRGAKDLAQIAAEIALRVEIPSVWARIWVIQDIVRIILPDFSQPYSQLIHNWMRYFR
ncbi:MAG: hypothetical protein AB1817_11935, partial [Chloroflexota bacterium]